MMVRYLALSFDSIWKLLLTCTIFLHWAHLVEVFNGRRKLRIRSTASWSSWLFALLCPASPFGEAALCLHRRCCFTIARDLWRRYLSSSIWLEPPRQRNRLRRDHGHSYVDGGLRRRAFLRLVAPHALRALDTILHQLGYKCFERNEDDSFVGTALCDECRQVT